MLELLFVVLSVIGVAAVVVFAAPRLIGYWFTHRCWTLSGSDVDGKFQGLTLFGMEGSYLAFTPKGEQSCVSFTKHKTESGEPAFRLAIKSDRLTASHTAAIETKLDALSEQVRWSTLIPVTPEGCEIELSGPLLSDPAAMEGIAKGVLTILGYDDSQKYRIAFEGPSDEGKVARFLCD